MGFSYEFDYMLERIPYPVALVDNSGIIVKINNSYEKFSGYSKEEIEEKINYEQLVFDENLEEVKFYHELRSKNLYSPSSYMWKYICKSGDIKDIFVIVSMMPNTSLRFVIIIDLSLLNRSNKVFHQYNYIYELVFKNSTSIMFMINQATGEILDINPSAQAFYGYRKKDFLEMKIQDISIGDGDQILKQINEHIESRSTSPQWFKHRLASGAIRDVDVYTTPILSEDNLVFFFIVHDITEKKELEEKLNEKVYSIVKTLAKVIELRDPYTAGHQEKVAKLTVAIAKEMGFSKERIKVLEFAALLHDIGKIEIPAEILSKPNKLTNIEFSLIKEHSRRGYEILKEVNFDEPIADFVLQHHEKLDGSGYPDGITKDDIFMEARIIAVADVVEAISSHRPYRPSLGIERALEEIKKYKGTKYDEEVVSICLELFLEKNFKF